MESREAILGDVTCYSFYPGKNLGAYGDGGAVVTDDGDLAEKMRSVGNHGRLDRYTHSAEGFNYRLDALQAAILDVKLGHLDEWNEKRRSRAKLYDAAFANGPVRPVEEAAGRYHVYHLYVVRTPHRDRLIDGLCETGDIGGDPLPGASPPPDRVQAHGARSGDVPRRREGGERDRFAPDVPGAL